MAQKAGYTVAINRVFARSLSGLHTSCAMCALEGHKKRTEARECAAGVVEKRNRDRSPCTSFCGRAGRNDPTEGKKENGQDGARSPRKGEQQCSTPRIPFLTGWRNDMSYGDIVLFRFPGMGQPAAAYPVVWPCLVLDVETLNVRRRAVLVPALQRTSGIIGARFGSAGSSRIWPDEAGSRDTISDPIAAERADLLVILTEWKEFARSIWHIAGSMARSRLADLRNIQDLNVAYEAGFDADESVDRLGIAAAGRGQCLRGAGPDGLSSARFSGATRQN